MSRIRTGQTIVSARDVDRELSLNASVPIDGSVILMCFGIS